METIISFLKYLATTNAVNFVIMIGILAFIVVKMNLKSGLDKSITNIADNIKNSDDEKVNAQKTLQTSQKNYENLPKEIESIKNETKIKIEALKNDIDLSTQKTIQSIENNTQKIISAEDKNLSNELLQNAFKSAIETAKQNITDTLKNNQKLHLKFIDDSLEELDKVNI